MMITHELDIAAPPEVVYEMFTDAELFGEWMAAVPELDPRPGGTMRWTHENGHTVGGTYEELVPYRRIVFAYGWEDGWLGVAANSTRVVVELTPTTTGTRLRVTHRGLEGDAAVQHRAGWAHFLGRLAEHAERQERP